ncbi:metallophosphoesterase [Candidatus Microgenomates bacterium]|nr:metallophosphoesterase [Candidatus Microgenomates bacterium]
MKVLHYSDFGDKNFLNLYSECDVLITTGDLSLFDFSGLEDIVDKKPAFGVYGNHDSGNYMDQLAITNVHNRVVEWNNLKIGGFQGCIKYKESPLMYTAEEAKSWAENFPYVDILLLHAGARGMLDDPSDEIHTGNESIRQYILGKKPKFVFCGHQYSEAEMTVGETKIYRAYGARLIEI